MSARERFKQRLSVALARWVFKATRPPQDVRALYERFSSVSREKLKRKFPKIKHHDHDLGGVYAESTCSVDKPERIVMHLHGGAYFCGSAASFRIRANNLSYRCRATVFMPEYRLAPENPFPVAFQDAKAAWLALVEQYPDESLYLSGDSAGGGLVLALTMSLRAEGLPMPKGCIAISPWTDLTLSSPSIDANGHLDWIDRERLTRWVPHVMGSEDPAHPRISPLFGDFTGLPPLLFVAGEHEAILDDARLCAARARDAGVTVHEVIGNGMIHDYPLAVPKFGESQRAWAAITDFVSEQT